AWASRRLLLPRRCVRLPTAATSISRPNPGRGSRSGVTPRVTWDWTSGAICRSPSTSPTDTHVGRPEHQSTHPPRRGTPMKRVLHSLPLLIGAAALSACGGGGDRKSTRLNSSHVKISYAVFCLKKKNEPALRRIIHVQ